MMNQTKIFRQCVVGISLFTLFVVMLLINFNMEKLEYFRNTIISEYIQPITIVTTKNPEKNPLPEVAIARRVWHKFPKSKWRGIQLPLLIAQPSGRLGNVMGEYATLYALGRIYGASVRLLPKMRRQLLGIFPNITMDLLPEDQYISSEWTTMTRLTNINYSPFEAAAAGILGPKLFRLSGSSFEIQLFNTYRKNIIQEFTFSDHLQSQVKSFWEKNLRSFDMVIGFHIRRTDYVKFIMSHFKARIPEYSYYKRATDYYREKFPGVRFLVASDDMPFAKNALKNYSDIIYTPGSPRQLDMALLASCNHSIMTLGSFGFWCGYLSRGEVVYPDITPKEDYPFQRSWYEVGQLDFFTPLPPY